MKYFAITHLLPIVIIFMATLYAAWFTNERIERAIMQTCLNNGTMNVGGVKFNCDPQRKAQ